MTIPASRFNDAICCVKDLMGGIVVAPCAPEVFISGMPAARLGDLATCFHAHVSPVAGGATEVLVHGLPAARIGVKTADGSPVITGDESVLIGGSVFAVPPNVIIEGDAEYQNKVVRDLYFLSTTKSGKAMIDRWEKAGLPIKIRRPQDDEGMHNNEEPWDKRLHPNEKTAAVIEYDPDHSTFSRTPDGELINIPPQEALMHEGIHAMHDVEGTTPAKRRSPGGDSMWNVEEQAIGTGAHKDDFPTENSLRDELGLKPPRTSHLKTQPKEGEAIPPAPNLRP